MKKIVALLLCLISVLSLSSCSSGTSDSGKEDNLDKQLEDAVDTLKDFINDSVATGEANKDNAVAEPVDPKTVDYSKIDITMEFTDADKIDQFMSDYQNGATDNKVIKFTGIMSKGMMDKTTNSILIKMDGGVKKGPQWRIVGADDNTEYPGDDNKIEITGVVLSEFNESWGMYAHYIYVLPENVKDLGAAE